MAENHTLRTTIIGGTVAALLASLLLEPVRAFIRSVWRFVTAAPGAVWDLLTASGLWRGALWLRPVRSPGPHR